MDKPDFSRYSEKELRQILTRIDSVRYPERVEEIEARLAAMASESTQATVESNVVVEAKTVAAIAGFWRRCGAFLIDMLVLGLLGMAAGAVLHEQFSKLGVWGRGLGFLVTLAYFGVTESRLGGGQSLGMKALGLRVVAKDGEMLNARAAFTRAGIFCLAYFLNGVVPSPSNGNDWVAMGLSVLLFGLSFSIFYTLIFNRRTRQSIHDLAVGALVVKAGPGKVSLSTVPIWRGHAVIVGVVILALPVFGFLASKQLLQNSSLASLLQIQQAVSALPGVDRAGVNLNSFSSNNVTTNRLFVSAVVSSSSQDSELLAVRIAQIALKTLPEASNQQEIVVTLTSGFDIGIASSWRSVNFVHSPEEWKAYKSSPQS